MKVTDVINLAVLVWPAIVVLLVFLFRDPIKNLLERLKSQGLKAHSTSWRSKPLARRRPSPFRRLTTRPLRLSLTKQRASHGGPAVHQAWRSVRWAAERALPGSKRSGATTMDAVQRLHDQGLVDDNVVQLTLTLRGLYYEMKAEPEALTSTAAADFVEAASTLARVLRTASTRTGPGAAPTDGALPGQLSNRQQQPKNRRVRFESCLQGI